MPEQMYRLELTAQGEVRDRDGNLISTQPVTGSVLLTAEQVDALADGEVK